MLQTIGYRRFVLVLVAIGLVYVALFVALIGAVTGSQAVVAAAASVLASILSFVGGFAAGILGARGQDDEALKPEAPKLEGDA